MEDKKLQDISAEEFRDMLADLRKSNQEQADYAKRAWIMSLISTIAVMIVAVFIVVYGAFLMPKVNRMLAQAESSLANIQKITEEVASVDFEGLIDDVGGLVATTEEDLGVTMRKIEDIDFEQLNKAIRDLSNVIEPMANFFKDLGF